MELEALIPFALLLIPGALAQYFYDRLRPGADPNSEFQWVFRSFLYGWPILIANWFVVRSWFSLGNDFNAVAGQFGNSWFVVVYFVSSLVFAFGWACLLILLRKPDIFSRVSKLLRHTVVVSEFPWDAMFFHNTPQAVEVRTADGIVHRGFVVLSSSDPKSPELLLKGLDIIDEHKECFTEFTRTYINTESGVTVQEYSLDAYLAKVKRMEESRNERQAEAPTQTRAS